MFKFGFSSDSQENSSEENVRDDDKLWKECKEITYEPGNKLVKTIFQQVSTTSVSFAFNDIKYFSSKEVLNLLLNQEQNLVENSLQRAEQNHSDLIPAVYEGGLKIWECTHDLLSYITECDVNFANKKVLDLGCGAGVVGIALLLKGATCCFQDYNTEVIQYLTIPNILLNCESEIKQCKCYSGDWGSFVDLLETSMEKFDYIFTSETIYNTESYPKLHNVFEKLLKKGGAIFLAAKSFYFGVGGGISLFQDFLDRQRIFKYTTCWKCEGGVKREILKIESNK